MEPQLALSNLEIVKINLGHLLFQFNDDKDLEHVQKIILCRYCNARTEVVIKISACIDKLPNYDNVLNAICGNDMKMQYIAVGL